MSNAIKRRMKKAEKKKAEAELIERNRKLNQSRVMTRELINMTGAIMSTVLFIAAIIIKVFWLKITIFLIGCAVAVLYIKSRFFDK